MEAMALLENGPPMDPESCSDQPSVTTRLYPRGFSERISSFLRASSAGRFLFIQTRNVGFRLCPAPVKARPLSGQNTQYQRLPNAPSVPRCSTMLTQIQPRSGPCLRSNGWMHWGGFPLFPLTYDHA